MMLDVDVDILLTKSTIDFSMRVAKSSGFAPSRQPMTTRSGHRENYALSSGIAFRDLLSLSFTLLPPQIMKCSTARVAYQILNIAHAPRSYSVNLERFPATVGFF